MQRKVFGAFFQFVRVGFFDVVFVFPALGGVDEGFEVGLFALFGFFDGVQPFFDDGRPGGLRAVDGPVVVEGDVLGRPDRFALGVFKLAGVLVVPVAVGFVGPAALFPDAQVVGLAE